MPKTESGKVVVLRSLSSESTLSGPSGGSSGGAKEPEGSTHQVVEETSKPAGKEEIQEGFFFGMSNNSNEDCWVLDSGATHHFVQDKRILFNQESKDLLILTRKDKAVLHIKQAGYVCFMSKQKPGDNFILTGVLHGDAININIISLLQMTAQGCIIIMAEDWMQIVRDGQLVCEGTDRNWSLHPVVTQGPTKWSNTFNAGVWSQNDLKVTPLTGTFESLDNR